VNVSYWLLQSAEILKASIIIYHIWHGSLGSHCSLNALTALSTCRNYRIIKISYCIELISNGVLSSKLASIIKLETAVSGVLGSSNHNSLSLRWPWSESLTLPSKFISSYNILSHRHVSTNLAEVKRVAVLRTHWTLCTISIHGINSWKEAASIRIEEAISSQLHLSPINMLHSIEFSIEKFLFIVCVLQLPQNSNVYEVKLLLDIQILISEFFFLCHTFLHMLS